MSVEHLRPPDLLIYQPSREVVRWLVENNPEIESFNFLTYRPRKPDPSALEDKIVTGPDDIPLELSREEILSNELDHLIEKLSPDISLGVNSNVIFPDGREGQIPMMDFKCEMSEENTALIKKLMGVIGCSGFLLTSGASYHFIGNEIFEDHRKWEQFLGTCLLSGMAHERYIGHVLDAGFNTLRIGVTEAHPVEPKVIDFIL